MLAPNEVSTIRKKILQSSPFETFQSPMYRMYFPPKWLPCCCVIWLLIDNTEAQSDFSQVVANISTMNLSPSNVNSSIAIAPNYPSDSLTLNITVTPTPAGSSTTVSSSVSGSSGSRYRDIGICWCDLTTVICDINCCCDPNCTTDDKLSFSIECRETGQSTTGYSVAQTCLDSNALISNNSNYPTYRASDSSLCLLYDNNAQRQIYQEQPSTVHTADFDQQWIVRGLSNGPLLPSMVQSTSPAIVYQILQRHPLVFKVSDPVFVVPVLGGMVRPLRIPASLDTSPTCLSFSQTNFLEASSSSCIFPISTPSHCTDNPLLHLQYHLNSTVVASAAALAFLQQNFVSNVDFTQLSPEDVQAVFVPVRLGSVSSQSTDGATTTTPATVSVPDIPTVQFAADGQTCSNVVSTIEYVITHNASTIVGVFVNAVLATINVSSSGLQQQQIVRFIPFLSTDNTDDYTEPLARSGNPGYLEGYPILVSPGLGLNDDGFQQTPSQVSVRALVLPGLDTLGRCSTIATEQVRFGENMQMSCLQYVDLSEPGVACTSLQALVVNTFESAGATLPTNVSAFGNGTVFTTDSSAWLPILRNFVPPTPTFAAPNICSGVVRGLSIEISYAKVGYLTNLQNSITGVYYRFSPPEQILLQCPFYGCATSNTTPIISLLPVEVRLAVSFSDFTQRSSGSSLKYYSLITCVTSCMLNVLSIFRS